jgi:hypothetical protein
MFVSPQTFLNNHTFWLKPERILIFFNPPAKAGGNTAKAGGNKNQSHAAT